MFPLKGQKRVKVKERERERGGGGMTGEGHEGLQSGAAESASDFQAAW